MRSFLLAAFAGAAYAATAMENINQVVPPTKFMTKDATPVELGTGTVNSGWSKVGTGTEQSINLKFEFVTTVAVAGKLTDNPSTWWVTMSKDKDTASSEILKVSFNTPATPVGSKTIMTCSSVVVKVAPSAITDVKATFATGGAPVTQAATLEADGYALTPALTPIADFWSADSAGATLTATAWTSRWTRTAAGETAAKIGGTSYALL